MHPHRGFGLSGTDLTIIHEYENPNLNNYYKSFVNVKILADIALKEEIIQIGRRSSEDLTRNRDVTYSMIHASDRNK